MTATQKHDIIPVCTTVLSADQQPKEDIMLDQQKITILYCRLSNEDAQDGESNSIANQREYLTRYARDHGYTNLKILVDDGYTGTNFNRPGVQEGFELVKQGLVGCWLVKDLSRFGRDYLTVGQYTDIIFPSYDVRFIAINDGVDSKLGDGEGFAAMRNLFNEWYPRDTSKKVRISLRQRGTSSKHMGKPPYGYRCDPEDKDHWLVDEEAAAVVRRIFRLAVEGHGPYDISKLLTAEKVECPGHYLARQREAQHRPGKRKGQSALDKNRPYDWYGNTVSTMLERPEYMGHTVNFRSSKKSYRDKRVKNAPEDWLVFENTHEAIVDPETWQLAQQVKRTVRRTDTTGVANPLTGLVFCADCGAKMYNHRGKHTRADGKEYRNDTYKLFHLLLDHRTRNPDVFFPQRQHQGSECSDSGNHPHYRQLCHPEQGGIYSESSQHFTGSPAGSGKGAETQGRQGAQAQRRAGCAD